jgi:hypothetical protein
MSIPHPQSFRRRLRRPAENDRPSVRSPLGGSCRCTSRWWSHRAGEARRTWPHRPSPAALALGRPASSGPARWPRHGGHRRHQRPERKLAAGRPGTVDVRILNVGPGRPGAAATSEPGVGLARTVPDLQAQVAGLVVKRHQTLRRAVGRAGRHRDRLRRLVTGTAGGEHEARGGGGDCSFHRFPACAMWTVLRFPVTPRIPIRGHITSRPTFT